MPDSKLSAESNAKFTSHSVAGSHCLSHNRARTARLEGKKAEQSVLDVTAGKQAASVKEYALLDAISRSHVTRTLRLGECSCMLLS